MGGAGPAPTTTSWRAVAAAAVALWLVPAVLALAVLWLPLLCCAVAAVRFLRVRRKLVAASTSTSRRSPSRGCCDCDDAGGRLRLLHQYLDDQVELVVVGVGGGAGHGHEEKEEGGTSSASC